MDTVTLITMLSILLYPSVIQGEITLSFNTSKFENSDDYYAHLGETVVLTCIVPSNARPVNILKRIRTPGGEWKYVKLVKRGELLEATADHGDKYSFAMLEDENNLVINNLTRADSSRFRCTSVTGTCSQGRRNCKMSRKRQTVSLEVKEKSSMTVVPEFCELVDDTDGIYFVGDDLTLRCPKNVTNVKVSEIWMNVTVMDDGSDFNLLTLNSLNEEVNGTTISCFRTIHTKSGVLHKDYCGSLPKITVFNKLSATLSVSNSVVSHNGYAVFSCQSHPFLASAIQWVIPETNVTFHVVNMSETFNGSRLWIESINFRNSTSLCVICNVTVGSKNTFQTAHICPETAMIDVTTYITSSSCNVNVEKTANREENGRRNQVAVAARVVVPIIICLALLTLGIVSGFSYIKVRQIANRKEDNKKVNLKDKLGNTKTQPFQTGSESKAELGLTEDYAEVADNVAYASYDNAFLEIA